MRVRIRRFGRLRSTAKPGYSQRIDGARRQSDVDQDAGVMPPAARVDGDLPCSDVGEPERSEVAVRRASSLPLFQLHGTQAMADPFVDVVEGPWSLRQPEVSFPAAEIFP